MADFANAKTPNPAEENDMELNLDALDGVAGGGGEKGGSDFAPQGKSEAEVNNGQNSGISPADAEDKRHSRVAGQFDFETLLPF